MPTMEEFKELLSECTWTKTTLNGESVYRVTGTNGRYIFLPWSIYWSCSFKKNAPVYLTVQWNGNYMDTSEDNYVSKSILFHVRPVCTIQE